MLLEAKLGFSKTIEKHKHVRHAYALGTDVALTVFHPDMGIANKAIDEALARIEHVEQLMSLYRPDSQLSILNRKGILIDPHPDLFAILSKAKDLSKLTEGAFDVTVQPLWNLFVNSSSLGRLPTDDEIQKVRQKVGWEHIELESDLICMNKAGTQITLNGMAQGMAADVAKQAFQENGIEHALIDTGEFSAMGRPEKKEAWHIAIMHNREPAKHLCETRLVDRCLATSGDYETRFSEDYNYHHIFDPRTGVSPAELSSVSVAAPSALEADALSTAVFVLGLNKGKGFIKTQDQVDALFVTKSGHVEQTEGFGICYEA